MATTQARQPEGIPVCGQFAATAHSYAVPAFELPDQPVSAHFFQGGHDRWSLNTNPVPTRCRARDP